MVIDSEGDQFSQREFQVSFRRRWELVGVMGSLVWLAGEFGSQCADEGQVFWKQAELQGGWIMVFRPIGGAGSLLLLLLFFLLVLICVC